MGPAAIKTEPLATACDAFFCVEAPLPLGVDVGLGFEAGPSGWVDTGALVLVEVAAVVDEEKTAEAVGDVPVGVDSCELGGEEGDSLRPGEVHPAAGGGALVSAGVVCCCWESERERARA